MLKRRRIVLPTVKTGYTVTILIPLADRGRGDPCNILGMIMSYNPTYDQYTIGTKVGILSETYSRNQFDVCDQTFLFSDDINKDKKIGFRQAVAAVSLWRPRIY